MYDKVVFFNHGHLGDTLLSKYFIREAKKLLNSKSYCISNGYDGSYNNDITEEHFAPRPSSEKLINKKLEDLGRNYMRDWKSCLRDYLSTL